MQRITSTCSDGIDGIDVGVIESAATPLPAPPVVFSAHPAFFPRYPVETTS